MGYEGQPLKHDMYQLHRVVLPSLLRRGQDVVGLIDRLDVCGVRFVIANLVSVAKPALCVICLLYLSTAGSDEDA